MEPIGDVLKKVVKKHHLGNQSEIEQEVLAEPHVQAFLKQHQKQVNEAIVRNSMPNLFEFYNQVKNSDKIMVGYQPELFLNGSVIDVRYTPTSQKLAQDHEQAVKQHLELIDLPQNLHQVKLSQIDMTQGRADALTSIQEFLTKYKKNIHQKGVYLSGDFGVGKTYILAGLANQVAALGKTVIFLHVPTFIAGLTSHFEDNSLQSEIKRVAECDLLILDDIGAESLSQWSRDDVLGVILQARMDNILPTFFSSNFDMEKLEAHFAETRNAIDPVKAARLMQRIRFLAKEVVVSGPNRRKI